MSKVQIIDNFLSPHNFKHIEKLLLGEILPWYCNVPDRYNRYQFTHTFYDVRPPWYGGSNDYLDFVKDDVFLPALGVRKLFRVKANLQVRTNFNRKSPGGYHIDYSNGITSIFYVNTNNGWTHIKGHGKVKSVANRMVLFDSNLEHIGHTCTNKNTRVVINFNFLR